MIFLSRFLVIAFALTLLGCNGKSPSAPTSGSAYFSVLPQETRETSFADLEKVRYLTSVVYRSAELRKAYVDEYASRYRYTAQEREALLKKELDEAEKYDVFFVSHFATDKDTARLTKEEKVWRLTLTHDSGAPISSESVVELSTKDNVQNYFYPFITPWSKNFLVKFSRPAESRELNLRMSGVIADLSFEWKRN